MKPTRSDSRRLLFMVAELHRRGYESLRILPYMAPSGLYWRCAIGPAALFSVEHGATVSESARHEDLVSYSSGQEACYFEWGDCTDSSTEQLADLFEQSFSDMLAQSRDADPDYVNWFADMLKQTEPGGLVYAFADWDCDENVLHVIGKCERETIPLPPPGRG